MKKTLWLLLAVAWLLAASTPILLGDGIAISSNVVVSFADLETGRKVLTNRDDFIAALSPFDRAARLGTNAAASDADFMEFVGRNVREWRPGETNRLAAILLQVGKKLGPWNLPFPPSILLIKTTGQEEFGFAYTRQNAIVLPGSFIRSTGDQILLHELFHVLSRHNPGLRTRLYGILGFHPINEIELPADLRQRSGTNPDGIQNGWRIAVTNRNRLLQVVPILCVAEGAFDPTKAGNVNDFFRLLVVTNQAGSWTPDLRGDGRPRLLRVSEAGGYRDQIGRNTDYIIHPDEILADNFVLLINGVTNLPTPRLLAEMKAELSRAPRTPVP